MREFDDYISSIIGNLSVSKNKKNEMADEYRDHLEMLKRDYINNGLADEEAVEKAIKSFGDSNKLKIKLSHNLHNYRSIPNIMFGIIFTVLLFVAGRDIPVPSIFMSADFMSRNLNIFILFLMVSISLFIPFGFFLPILLKKAGKVRNTVLASLLLSPFIGIFLCIDLGLRKEFIIADITGGLIGSAIGFTVLILVNKVSLSVRYLQKSP